MSWISGGRRFRTVRGYDSRWGKAKTHIVIWNKETKRYDPICSKGADPLSGVKPFTDDDEEVTCYICLDQMELYDIKQKVKR